MSDLHGKTLMERQDWLMEAVSEHWYAYTEDVETATMAVTMKDDFMIEDYVLVAGK